MVPKDVRACAEVIANHPVLGPRYQGRALADLSAAWLRVLGSESIVGAVFEESEGSRFVFRGFGISVFVTDDFMWQVKKPPLVWSGFELATRILQGRSPVLSERQLREANSKEGLNLIVWEAIPQTGFEKRADIYHLMVTSFIEVHRGYRLKEMITSPVESVERLQWALDAGGLLWNPSAGRYDRCPERKYRDLVNQPHVIGVTRDAEFARPGTWVGTLFDYHPPKFGFSRSEQAMLWRALDGGTDASLSKELGVSLPTVKKMWLSVYRRMGDHIPELNHDSSPADATAIRRGKEKKRHLLAYLRNHPEELRPVSQNLLR
ncbi:MAG: hypothetical protein WBQ34_09285 [Candidatus Acidiferrales bacterium]